MIIKWSDTLKQFVDNLAMNSLSLLDHFEGLALKRVKIFNMLFLR